MGLSPSRIMKRSSSGAAISTAQSIVVINERERETITVLGDNFAEEQINQPTGVVSAHFVKFNGARCFFHAVYTKDGEESND